MMEKMLKRLLSLAVAFVLVLGMVPAGGLQVFAVEDTSIATASEEAKVELPEVVVTDITSSLDENAPELTYALNFAIKDMDALTEEYLQEVLEAYGDYYTDYVITISGLSQDSVTFHTEEGADGYLAGQYDGWSENWVSVPPADKEVTVNNGESLYIMATAAELFGKTGLRFTLAEVADIVQNFDCGIYFTPEFLEANPNMEVALELKVFTENAEGEIEEDISVAAQEFEAQKVKLPEVVITDIKDSLDETAPDLTYALNFAIKDLDKLTDEYLEALFAAYGNYYTDYVITISGLSQDSVTFHTGEGADGYLAGQYDAWSENWVSVPPADKAVTLENGESLYIMETAAELYGKTGLRYTLAEVAEVVQNFDCGIYFTPEFLAANPDMEVTLELKVFTEDANGEIAENIRVATNTFENNFVAVIAGEEIKTGYYTSVADALAAAKNGETVQMVADAKETEIYVKRGRVLDLNGYTLETEDAAAPFATSQIIDSKNSTGVLKVSQDCLAILDGCEQLPVWVEEDEGFHFVAITFTQDLLDRGEGNARFRFWTDGAEDCFLDQILTNGGLDNKITVKIKMSWTNSSNTISEQYFIFPDALVAEYAEDFDGSSFQLEATGLDGVQNVKFTGMFCYGDSVILAADEPRAYN